MMCNVQAGDIVQFKGPNNYATNNSGYYDYIKTSDDCFYYVYGNIMSLIGIEDFKTNRSLPRKSTFRGLFASGGHSGLLLNKHKTLHLPATGLTQECYQALFYGCTGLTTVVPSLPAKTVGQNSYTSFFENCTGLTTPPKLPATTLSSSSYSSMFKGCISLKYAPELPALTAPQSCYYSMFSGCTNMVKGPSVLPATILNGGTNYRYMFENCSSLIKAPEIKAENTQQRCMQLMFNGCTSLIKPPSKLLSLSLASESYHNMFANCISLTETPELCATTIGQRGYRGMFRNCYSLKTPATFASSMTLTAAECFWDMYYGCTALTSLPTLTMTGLTTNCCNEMFYNCKSITGVPADYLP